MSYKSCASFVCNFCSCDCTFCVCVCVVFVNSREFNTIKFARIAKTTCSHTQKTTSGQCWIRALASFLLKIIDDTKLIYTLKNSQMRICQVAFFRNCILNVHDSDIITQLFYSIYMHTLQYTLCSQPNTGPPDRRRRRLLQNLLFRRNTLLQNAICETCSMIKTISRKIMLISKRNHVCIRDSGRLMRAFANW